MKTSIRAKSFIVLLLCGAGFMSVPRARAAGHVVTMDQAGLMAGMAGGGTVVFDNSGTIVLTQTVVVAQDTVLDGSGRTVIISGNNAVRVFAVNPGVHFGLVNLTIANGATTGANSTGQGVPGQDAIAGGLYNQGGTVDVTGCSFTGNSASGGSGTNGANGGGAFGAAIYNDSGGLNITNSTFSTNTATGGSCTVSGFFPPAATGGKAFGGAIYNRGGTVNLSNNAFSANHAVAGKVNPPFASFVSGMVGGLASGGAIYSTNGSLNFINTTVSANTSIGGSTVDGNTSGNAFGGGVASLAGNVTVLNGGFNNNLALSDVVPSPQGGTGGVAGGGGIYLGSGTLTITGATFATNNATGSTVIYWFGNSGNGNGGGVYAGGTLNSTNCIFLANQAAGGGLGGQAGNGNGGAVYNLGIATIVNATISANGAIGGPGQYQQPFGAANPPGNGLGGGLYNSGTLVLLNSTLSSNYATGGAVASPAFGGAGAGSAFGGGVYDSGNLSATNNTFAANWVYGGAGYYNQPGNGYGGALYNAGGTNLLTYASFARNSAVGGSANTNTGSNYGGAIASTNGSFTLLDSIVAYSAANANAWGVISDGGYNISSDGSCNFSATGSLNNTDPLLGPLANYGGATLTIPLLAGSPAIDAAGGFCPATDQRGTNRPAGGGCDIGAYEAVGAPLYVIGGAITGTLPPGGVTVTVGTNSVNTGASTNYEVALIGGTYTVTPSAAGYFFVPSNQVVTLGPNNLSVNFTSQPLPTYSIAGLIGGYIPPGGVSVSDGLQSTNTDQNGNYVFTGVYAGSYTITPAAPGTGFSPTNQTVSVGPNTNGINFTGYQMNVLSVTKYVPPVLQLGFRGTNGQTWVLTGTTNFIITGVTPTNRIVTGTNWTAVATNVVGPDGTCNFFVTNSPGQPRRFFRAHSP